MRDEITDVPAATTVFQQLMADSTLAADVSRTSVADLASGRGRRHGTSNVDAFDRWFRYPAGFASDYASALLQRLDLPKNGVLLDCFAGSGVIGTAAQRSGLQFYGIEAHPLIAELARL